MSGGNFEYQPDPVNLPVNPDKSIYFAENLKIMVEHPDNIDNFINATLSKYDVEVFFTKDKKKIIMAKKKPVENSIED